MQSGKKVLLLGCVGKDCHEVLWKRTIDEKGFEEKYLLFLLF